MILIHEGALTKRKKIVLLSISVISSGIIFGGFPNVILLTGLIFLILGLTLIFGRIFCGYVCPLGAVQELTSMVRFKTTFDQERILKKKNYAVAVRWIFFGVIAALLFIYGFDSILFLNPASGFLFIWFPMNFFFLIALILLITVIMVSFFVYRPFCRYICPFGALASLVSKISRFKVNRTESCTDCGICEKICPILVCSRNNNKGECYLCSRCLDFCSNEMFINPRKISQINQYLSAITLNLDMVSKEKSLEKNVKSIIRLFTPNNHAHRFNDLMNALEDRKKFPVESIQKIVTRLREIFPDEIEGIVRTKYKKWIRQNESRWKEYIDPYLQDKIIYGWKW